MHDKTKEKAFRRIAYREGYKYQLHDNYTIAIPLRPTVDIQTGYIDLTADGVLTIKKGYAWDGPSGPTFDTLTFMRGALVHDALYQLMRERHLDHKKHRKIADRIMRRICREDGMFVFRSWYVYLAVRIFADFAADPANKRPVIHAPKKK
jgi:hypothetical protein